MGASFGCHGGGYAVRPLDNLLPQFGTLQLDSLGLRGSTVQKFPLLAHRAIFGLSTVFDMSKKTHMKLSNEYNRLVALSSLLVN